MDNNPIESPEHSEEDLGSAEFSDSGLNDNPPDIQMHLDSRFYAQLRQMRARSGPYSRLEDSLGLYGEFGSVRSRISRDTGEYNEILEKLDSPDDIEVL